MLPSKLSFEIAMPPGLNTSPSPSNDAPQGPSEEAFLFSNKTSILREPSLQPSLLPPLTPPPANSIYSNYVFKPFPSSSVFKTNRRAS